MNSKLTFNKELLLALAGLAILIAIPFSRRGESHLIL